MMAAVGIGFRPLLREPNAMLLRFVSRGNDFGARWPPAFGIPGRRRVGSGSRRRRPPSYPPPKGPESCFRPSAAGQIAMPIRAPRVFTIPPGAPFLATLSRALVEGELIEGFPGPGGPLALAEATIYVPTQRAATALAGALLEASGPEACSSRASPRSAPSNRRGRDVRRRHGRRDAVRAGAPPSASSPAGTRSPARRRWGEALRGAIRSADARRPLEFDAREPALVASTPSQAYALAGDLAALIDDMIIEKVDPKALQTLEAGRRLRPLLAHHPRLPQDRVRRLAAMARRARPDRPRGPRGGDGRGRDLRARLGRAPPGADHHRRLDRRQPRHRRPDRRHRPGRAGRRGAARPRLRLDDRAWAMIGARDGGEGGLAGHPQARSTG